MSFFSIVAALLVIGVLYAGYFNLSDSGSTMSEGGVVKGTSQVFPGGPPVVKAALGIDITKEDLGDERTQVYQF